MSTTHICEICDDETERISECRSCKTKCCPRCFFGTECVDCMADEEDDMKVGKFGKYDF